MDTESRELMELSRAAVFQLAGLEKRNERSDDVNFVFERGSNHGAGIGSSRFLDQDELPPGDPPNADDERRISQLQY